MLPDRKKFVNHYYWEPEEPSSVVGDAVVGRTQMVEQRQHLVLVALALAFAAVVIWFSFGDGPAPASGPAPSSAVRTHD